MENYDFFAVQSDLLSQQNDTDTTDAIVTKVFDNIMPWLFIILTAVGLLGLLFTLRRYGKLRLSIQIQYMLLFTASCLCMFIHYMLMTFATAQYVSRPALLNILDSGFVIVRQFSILLLVFFWIEMLKLLTCVDRQECLQFTRRLKIVFWTLLAVALTLNIVFLVIVPRTAYNIVLSWVLFPLIEYGMAITVLAFAIKLMRTLSNPEYGAFPKNLLLHLRKVLYLSFFWGAILIIRGTKRIVFAAWKQKHMDHIFAYSRSRDAVQIVLSSVLLDVIPSIIIIYMVAIAPRKRKDKRVNSLPVSSMHVDDSSVPQTGYYVALRE